MNRSGRYVLLMLSVAATTVGAARAPTTRPVAAVVPVNEVRRYDYFQPLVNKNIFSRTRTGMADYRPRDNSREQRGPTLDQTLVVTGIVQPEKDPGQELSAFIEDRSTGLTKRYHVGETVAGGKIVSIGFGFVNFEAGGKQVKVDIGMSLAGVAPATQPYYAAGTTPPASTGVTPAPLPPGAGDLAERMRLRRQQGQ